MMQPESARWRLLSVLKPKPGEEPGYWRIQRYHPYDGAWEHYDSFKGTEEEAEAHLRICAVYDRFSESGLVGYYDLEGKRIGP